MRERTYQEVVTTREYTLWGKVAAQPTEKLSTWLKYAYSWRDNSVYGTSYWFGYPENPLLRKFYLADRERNMARGAARLRDQREGLDRRLGRLCRRRLQPFLGRPHLGAQRQRRRRACDRLHRTDPRPRLLPDPAGPFAAERQRGVRRARLDRAHEGHVRGVRASASSTWPSRTSSTSARTSRSRARSSDVAVDNILAAPAFPNAKTKLETFKLYGTYNLKDNLSITGSYQYEHYDTNGLAARRHRPGDRLQPARARRAGARTIR